MKDQIFQLVHRCGLFTLEELSTKTGIDNTAMTNMPSIQRFGDELAGIFEDQSMVVFLCGPSLKEMSASGAKLRKELQEALEYEGFEVVLGEDDGLENLRKMYGHYAHENELQFIQSQCNAVVLIAASAGSLCELGLFSYQKVHSRDGYADFILILDEKHQGKATYVSEGPATAIEDFGKVFYGNLECFDYKPLIDRLIRRRAVYFTDTRGRPSGGVS